MQLKTTQPKEKLTFTQWQRHIRNELFNTQKRVMAYKIREIVSGDIRNVQPSR